MILRAIRTDQSMTVDAAVDAEPAVWGNAMNDAIAQFNFTPGTIRFYASKAEIDQLTGAGVIESGIFNQIRVVEAT